MTEPRHLDTTAIQEILNAADGVTTEIVPIGGGVEWLIVKHLDEETFTGPHFRANDKLVCETDDLFVWRYDGDDEVPLWECTADATEQSVAQAILALLALGE